MGLDSRHVFPRLCDWAMSDPRMGKLRIEVLTGVGGEVLEIGFGTGLNLTHYPEHVRRITTVDPNPGLNRLARRRITESGIEITSGFWAANGVPIFRAPHWAEGRYRTSQPPIEEFAPMAAGVQSRFFTMGLARRGDGEWMIVELGDGQVSGLPRKSDADRFHEALSECWPSPPGP
ncbi:MAG TPA: ATP-grasp domain-containing protein [Isosphaeraceae bacterium]|nr:ATP-grasp domain-containing protein [Isosphaeraceae bacterium]